MPADRTASTKDASVDLYWLPRGAGGHSVRFNGRAFEAVAARLHHRTRRDLYHSALIVTLDGGDRYAIEQAPISDGRGAERGVVLEGRVGARRAGRFSARLLHPGSSAVESHRLTGRRRCESEHLRLWACCSAGRDRRCFVASPYCGGSNMRAIAEANDPSIGHHQAFSVPGSNDG